MATGVTVSRQGEEKISGKSFAANVLRIALGLALTLAVVGRAAAQYGGMGGGTTGTGGTPGGTYTAPKGGYGNGAAVGAAVGAAAGAGILFLALHNHGTMTGCVQPAEDGLRIVDEKKNASYALRPGDVLVKPGERVQLRGQKSKSDSGVQTFTAKKLVKNLGACGEVKSSSEAQPAKQERASSY
jgi:hypothetical protein